MTIDKREETIQESLDAGAPPNRQDPESIAYWRVNHALRDVRPVLSEGFAARVASAAVRFRLRPSGLSALVPMMTSIAALVLGAGVLSGMESAGYLESSPLDVVALAGGIPLEMVMGCAAVAALVLVDALISERNQEI